MDNFVGVLESFSLIFSSIILEALPFILIGALVSAFMQTFLNNEMIERVTPNNKLLGGVAAALLGLIFPVCECATVPIARGLIRKGVPLNIALAYMLAAPIINPVVLMSTYYAFNGSGKIVAYRALFGLLIAVVVGYLVDILNGTESVLKNNSLFVNDSCSCGCSGYLNKKSKYLSILNHTSKELYEIGRFLIIGAAVASFFQVVIPRDKLLALGSNTVLSIWIMMMFAFLISLCSEADAFIASTFLGSLNLGPVMAFLLLGPMVDVKNAAMLFSAFKKSFVVKLIFCIFSLCFIACCVII
ncbi:hypothetical protein CPJCM30710_20090 [Clostridium polyendosporum]|uniref:Permease n=1 Tax=Clostridium polyendosporum TaxID=69208 RepID=A0A919VM90_9CLOT|nr:permease [Clostridium polyendosporum]GIM29343.1 hypothetical protein CPJCM30710_20090 [Clostridium polyendosporum]